jgi:hypothetical protein
MSVCRHAAENLKTALHRYAASKDDSDGAVLTSYNATADEGSKAMASVTLQGVGRFVTWCLSNPHLMIGSALLVKRFSQNNDKNSPLPVGEDNGFPLAPAPVLKLQKFVGAAAAFVSALRPPMPLFAGLRTVK